MKDSNYQLAVQLRRELHAHPELSNQEIWTKAHLMDFLRRNTSRIELVDKGSWFYGAYRAGGDLPGLAFRADFDAVPVADGCGAPYASAVPGVSHACGHDGHSACLAALALEIDQRGAEKNVFFLFQHAEETGDGAAACVELFQEERVDEIFGYWMERSTARQKALFFLTREFPLTPVCRKKGAIPPLPLPPSSDNWER